LASTLKTRPRGSDLELGLRVLASTLKTRPRGSDLELGLRVLTSALKTWPRGSDLDLGLKSFVLDLEDSASWFWPRPWPRPQEFCPRPWRLGLVVLTLTSASEFWPGPWRLGLVVLTLTSASRVLASTLALASAFWPCLTSPDKVKNPKKALFGDQKVNCFDNTGSH